MSTRTDPWADGTPCWTDLATPDVAGAARFYRAVLGWNPVDQGEAVGHYHLCLVGDHAAAGMMAQDPNDSGPSAWTTYLAHSDVDKACTAVTAGGGAIVAPPMDVTDLGRMALAQDPTGAVFGLWQARSMIGSTIVNEPGGVGWNECMSRDPARARAFYSAVFGYTYTVIDGAPDYATIDGAGPGGTVGGTGLIGADEPADTPAHWNVYFVLADVDAAAATAASSGGSVRHAPFDTEFGRMAEIADPYGATFWLAGTSV
jgi:predicted enzyme related to lactoylglutathione lyase